MKNFKILSILLSLTLVLTALTGCAQSPEGETAPETYEIYTPQSAKSALVYDTGTKTILCAYEPDARMDPGGLTKLVTAALALENCDPEEQVTNETLQKYDLQSLFTIDLYRHETLSVRDLAAALLLQGANDAAMVLADHVAGSQEAFVERMNGWAAEQGCTDTKFVSSYGMKTDGDYTTARDLVKILEGALKNETFRELFGTAFYEIPATDRSEARQLYTFNYMLDQHIIPEFYDKRVNGGMQSVEYSDTNLICTLRDGRIAVVLGAERILAENGWQVERYGNFDEMAALLDSCPAA